MRKITQLDFFRNRTKVNSHWFGWLTFCMLLFTSYGYSQQCEIAVTISWDDYADVTTWELLDGNGQAVLSGGPYSSYSSSDTQTYQATTPPYSLKIIVDDSLSWYCDNVIDYSVNVGGNQDIQGTVTACFDIEIQTIPLNAALTACIPDCPAPSGIIITPTSLTAADISWTASSAALLDSYEYAVTTSATPPASGTVITGTSFSVSDLASDTTHYLHVRTNCDAAEVSTWATKSFYLGYCLPTYSIGCTSGDRISNVTLQGESITLDNTSLCSPAAYGDYTGLSSPDLAPGNTYNISISTDYNSPIDEKAKAWIDYNKDGAFSEDELIANTGSAGLAGYTANFSFTVPIGLTAGDYRMRVRLAYDSFAFNACSSDTYGEVEDYTISIIQLDNCVGTPTAGTVTSPIFSCANESFTLSTLGATAPADGLTGIWQSSPAGMNDWTNITGATSVNYTMTNGVTSNTDFRYTMTCSFSNETDTSDTISVIMNAATDCYCIPAGTNATNYITDFTTTGGAINISNLGSGLSANGYGDFTFFHNTTQDVGGTVNFEAQAAGTTTSGFKIWIDLNQNGSFDDDGELVYATTAYSNTHIGSFVVPFNALEGQTRMRIGNSSTPNTGPANPCMTNLSGEYEDYMFTVTIPSCMPVGSLSISNLTANSVDLGWIGDGTTFDISWGEGTFDAENGTIVPFVNGATLSGLNADTAYQFYVRQDCGAEESVWAGPYTFFTGYCVPPTTGTYYFNSISTTGGLTNISLSKTAKDTGGYGNYAATHIVTGYEGQEIDISMTMNTSTHYFYVWIDLNNDFVFDVDETVVATTSFLISYSGTLIIPALPLGDYRVRIGSSWSGVITPCGSANGEYQDFTLTVIDIPSCMPVADLTATDQTIDTAVLSWTSDGTLFDIELVEEGTVPTGTPTHTGVANSFTAINLTPSTSYEFYVRQDCGTVNGVSIWVGPFRFTTECLPPNITGTTPGEVCGEGEVTLSATADAGTIAWYANETGGTKLSEGASFTTPSITETTSYWVETFEGINGVGGRLEPNFTSGSYTTASNYGLVFTATDSFVLNTVDVYLVGTAGNLVVNLTTNTGTVLDTRTIALPALGTTTAPVPHTINLDFEIEPGEYRLIAQSSPNMVREASVGGFPYAVGDVASITNGYISGTSTTYYYFYNWIYNNGCGSPRTEVIATVTDAPDFALSQTTLEICEGNTSDAVTIATGASDYDTFEWTPSLGVSGDATTGWSFDPTETTTYVLTASQLTGAECATSINVEIIVNAAPAINSIITSATEVCNGTSVEISVLTAEPLSYCSVAFPSNVEPITLVQISNINNTTSATVNGTPALEDFTTIVGDFEAGATYPITVNGNTGGSYTNNFYVYIDWNQNGVFTDPGETYSIGSINGNNGSGTPLTGNITVPAAALNGNTRMRVLKKFSAATSPGSCNTTGFGQAEDYTVNVTGGVDLYEYSWSDGTSEVGTTSSLTVSPTTTTTYTVTATGANGCTITESIEITVNQTPDAPVATSPQMMNEGQTIADIIVTGDNLTWYTDEDLTNEVDASTVLTEGLYTFYVTASQGNCTSEATEIMVEVTLSTKDFDTATFKAYPNPVKDYFTISYSKDIQNIAVINMLGQTIFTKTVNATDTQIDMTSLPTGTYFVKVNVDGAVKTIKVVKQ